MERVPEATPPPHGLHLLLGLGLVLSGVGCTVISDDALGYRLGDSGADGGGLDGGGQDGGGQDGGGLDGGGLDGGGLDGGGDTGCPDPLTWYADGDGDGLGDPGDSVEECDQPTGYVDNALDCDDDDALVGAGGPWFVDGDGDGWGLAGESITGCEQPEGRAGNDQDCDDGDALVNPGATETCETAGDDDCDSLSNVQDAPGCTDFLLDQDADGYGIAGDSECWCAPEGEYGALLPDDCDDGEAMANPGLDEVCGDGIDNDCDLLACRETGLRTEADADVDLRAGAGSALGEELAWLGDVDGDGQDDLALGAAELSLGGLALGGAYVQLGGDLGSVDLSLDADAMWVGEASGDVAGRALAGLPDLDGDGLPELVVGAPSADGGTTDAGAVYLVYGPAGRSGSLGDADVRLLGDVTYLYGGRSVAGLPDATGDGLPDLLFGLPGDDSVANNAGSALLVAGPFTGGTSFSEVEHARLLGEAGSDGAGRHVAAAGDLDGDGLEDMLVGAHQNDAGGTNAGAVYLVSGGLSGSLSLADADGILLGESAGDLLGRAFAAAGDVDGDGLGDLVLGAEGRDSVAADSGSAYLVLSPVGGTVSMSSMIELLGEAEGDGAGTSVSGAGDLDLDGRAELLIGAPGSDRGGEDGGAAYLVFGPPGPGRSLGSAEQVHVGLEGGLGTAVVGGADYDGDGSPDLAIGAPGANAGDGRVLIFLGGGL